jgi:hypothetical protein
VVIDPVHRKDHPMADLTDDATPEVAAVDKPGYGQDPVAALGSIAYALFVLDEPGPLAEVTALADSQAARIPAQDGRTVERDLFQEKLLGELGALDL